MPYVFNVFRDLKVEKLRVVLAVAELPHPESGIHNLFFGGSATLWIY